MLFPLKGKSQWRRLGPVFSEAIGSVFVVDSGKNPNYTAFVGTMKLDDAASVWRTSDGGKSWQEVYLAPTHFETQITAFTFKDSLTGWFSSLYNAGCHKTTDGGKTWFNLTLDNTPSHGSSVYYHKPTKMLFLSRWDNNVALLSSDEGNTWQPLGYNFTTGILGYNITGFAFSDSLNGIASAAFPGTPWATPYFRTSDGGMTWVENNSQDDETYQPTAFKNKFYIVGDTNKAIKRSDDNGISWNLVTHFPTDYVEMIGSDSSSLFIQAGGWPGVYNDFVSPLGFRKSDDGGLTWQDICGPDNFNWTRFYVSDYGIWAGDSLGTLWFNRTKRGVGPRLQIVTKNVHATVDSIIPIQLTYPTESYYENVDTVSFILNHTGELLGFDHVMPASGWQFVRTNAGSNSDTCVLKYTGTPQPTLNSLVATMYYKLFISKDTQSTVTLDEVNFNKDVTFRDCMLSTLSATDTLNVSLDPTCGDSTIREFEKTGRILTITSIHPNPSQDELEIDLQSSMKQDAPIEIFDALGVKVFSDVKNVAGGLSSIYLNTHGFPSGIYIVRVAGVSQSFVKIR